MEWNFCSISGRLRGAYQLRWKLLKTRLPKGESHVVSPGAGGSGAILAGFTAGEVFSCNFPFGLWLLYIPAVIASV